MQHAEGVLVAMAQRGDIAAFTELVERRQVSLRQLMYRLSGDQSLAEDLAQQTFIKVWQNLSKLQNVQKFPGWFKRTAVNTFLSHTRSNKAATTSTEETTELPSTYATADPTLTDDLERALATLEEIPRTCVVLAYLEGMTNAEVAEHLELPLGTVKSHIRRGSERLRQELADYDPNSEANDG